eukprot:CAMPEP_0184860518 /NCGR_PEP_ID=MMETSP0580-20130426/5400_1 /TAXON_ID=1118495 /ORGANISM="Dactyliosolen fragilissimus" /LENGTH=139 /DNA_ID=CAMNT_0027357655 /DNA_START=156 /DNA_END=575 /DNA_ORIENTATION=-
MNTTNEDDTILKRTNVRKVFQGIAQFGPGVCLLALAQNIPEQPLAAQSLLTVAIGLQQFNVAGFSAAAQEKAGEKWSGLLYSLTSIPGVMFGSFGVYLTGLILDATGQDWSGVFGLNALIDFAGAMAFISLYNSRKEFD